MRSGFYSPFPFSILRFQIPGIGGTAPQYKVPCRLIRLRTGQGAAGGEVARSGVETPERSIRPGDGVIEIGIARLHASAGKAHGVRTGRILRDAAGHRRDAGTNRAAFL